jgi:hypothetical protein
MGISLDASIPNLTSFVGNVDHQETASHAACNAVPSFIQSATMSVGHQIHFCEKGPDVEGQNRMGTAPKIIANSELAGWRKYPSDHVISNEALPAFSSVALDRLPIAFEWC